MLSDNRNAALFVSPLLRAREIKMAYALRELGWKVVLIYTSNTPFTPDRFFDIAIRARSDAEAHSLAMQLRPRICHVFSGAIDDLTIKLCNEKPGPLVIDLNDVFCPALFNYCEERFEPTRDCLAKADALCARDLQPRFAAQLDGFELPRRTLLFPEYPWADPPAQSVLQGRRDGDEIRIVSVGTFSLETQGTYDSCYLRLAEMITSHNIHFHIYPHWFYKNSPMSSFNWDPKEHLAEFYALQSRTPYLHIHESVSLDVLRSELPAYDFGLISGGCPDFGQRLHMVTKEYMESCYSGRIADYLDARLPILINKEVGYNLHLLNHYRIAADLNRVTDPGFRDYLRELKDDPEQQRRVEEAADRLSLRRQAPRLAQFYRKLINELCDTSPFSMRPRRRWLMAEKLPIVGQRLRFLKARSEDLNETVDELRASLTRQRQLQLEQRSEAVQLRRELQQTRKDYSRVEQERAQQQIREDSLRAEQDRLRTKTDRYFELQTGPISVDLVAGLLNWPELVSVQERENGFDELLHQITLYSAATGPLSAISAAWALLARKNFDELLSSGYCNFKRSVARNYFTFLIQDGDPQLTALEAATDPETCTGLRAAADALPDDPGLDLPRQAVYRYFLLLLWHYARKLDTDRHLDTLQEPAEGNPIALKLGDRSISQDLINSVIEYYSIGEVVDFSDQRILEVGGGYGRNAFVIAKLNPAVRYTLVDIPPALYIAQRYLSAVFPGANVFRVRDFHSYRDIKSEIEDASFVFLLPHQLCLLPDGYFNICINISSFGEMRKKVVREYFDEIDRLTRGVFYHKQWKLSKNPFDRADIGIDDYPVRSEWQQLYRREARVQTEFFEAAYRIGGRG